MTDKPVRPSRAQRRDVTSRAPAQVPPPSAGGGVGVVWGVVGVAFLVVSMVGFLVLSEWRLLQEERGQLRRWSDTLANSSPSILVSNLTTGSPLPTPSPDVDVHLAGLKRWEVEPSLQEWEDAFADGAAVPIPACSCCGSEYQRTVIILTYGRTGSTLLVSLLGTVDGYDVRGETEEFMYTQFKLHLRMLSRRDAMLAAAAAQDQPVDARHPFVGLDRYNESVAFAQARELFLCSVVRPAPHARAVVFKDISAVTYADLPQFLVYMARVLPRVHFVVSSRNLTAVNRSSWWRTQPRAALEFRQDALDRVAASMPPARLCNTTYEEFSGGPRGVVPLLTCLGEDWHYREDPVMEVLAKRHSTFE